MGSVPRARPFLYLDPPAAASDRAAGWEGSLYVIRRIRHRYASAMHPMAQR